MSERLVLLPSPADAPDYRNNEVRPHALFYFFGMLLIKVVGTLSALVHEIPGKV